MSTIVALEPQNGKPQTFLGTYLGERLRDGQPRTKGHAEGRAATRKPITLTNAHCAALIDGHLQIVRRDKLK